MRASLFLDSIWSKVEHDLGDRFSSRRRLVTIITLGMLTGLGPLTIDLYLPAFPSLKLDLGIDDPQVQLTLSATIVGFSLGQLLIGPVSDRFGRRAPLLAMTALHVVSSVLVALAPNVTLLTMLRAIQGLAAAGGAVVAMAMARDLFSGRRLVKMLSRLALISGLAPILAPLLGSWLVVVLNWRGIFWVLAVYGALIVLLVGTLIQETRPVQDRPARGTGQLKAAYHRVLTDSTFVGVALTAAFAFAGLFSYVSSSSVLFQETYRLSAQQFGLVFATGSIGIFVGLQLASRMATRYGPQWTLVAGTGLMLFASLALLAINHVTASAWPLIPGIFTYTLGFGASMPNCQVIGLQNHRRDSGTAASLMGSLNMAMAAIVGPVIGAFELVSAAPMAVSMLICATASTTALWLIVKPHRVRIDFD